METFTSRRDLVNSFPRHGMVVEVGVMEGNFSNHILVTCAPKHLWLVDPWSWPHPNQKETHQARQAIADTGEEAYLRVVSRFWMEPNVTIIRTPSFNAATVFEDVSLDWVYIDGDHSFTGCLEDLTVWYPKLKPNGILAGNDFGGESVRKALSVFARKNPHLHMRTTDEKNPNWWFVSTEKKDLAEEIKT